MYFFTLALLLLATVTSGLQVFGDYGEVSDYKRQEGGEEGGLDHSGHWTAGGSDHEGRGHGEKLHNSHFYGGSGEVGEGGSKAGGHLKQKVTKGYQNYHHKDEVGRTTSYIDTSGDSGDHYGNYDSDRAWGSHGHGGLHRDHHASGYSGQNGLTDQKFSQKKGDYKGNIAEVIYAKKPTYYSKPYQPQVPYPYYFY